ncbi:hypothetical protein [Bifidobacterium stellenboschense]|uniref:DUF8094 domain-containing protein n=1 Tax=Bifidobacterium stellenboschense TaxID=762211 RepID=A0A087DN83_9BIFI|nr:hypothetical protein [Bifidobacterium stellenboschense]KFI96983.1 hypothetical protein BSTEL_1892 [Bifidobacterium stellenboschense]
MTRKGTIAAKLTALVLSAGMLVSLAACEGQVPKTSTAESADRTPDLTVAQEKKIRTSILDVIDAANQSKSTDGLDARLTGPQLEVRVSELAIAQATGTLDAKAAIPRKITQTVIPVDDGWPRTVFTITTTTEDQQSKRLLVMTQDSARQNYKLWGVARLFQGAKLPKFEVPKLGTEMGTAKDAKLVATPADAVAWYTDLLNNGDSSKYKDKFADDLFRSDLQKLDATVQQGMEANKGTQEQEFTVAKDQLKIMRSTDGGDLVVARIDSTWTRQAGEGRESLPASDAEKALFGDGKATSTMKVTYVNVIAMYIPPAGSTGAAAKITAVGAERQPVKVEAL